MRETKIPAKHRTACRSAEGKAAKAPRRSPAISSPREWSGETSERNGYGAARVATGCKSEPRPMFTHGAPSENKHLHINARRRRGRGVCHGREK